MRQHPSRSELALKALVVDEPVDFFQDRLQMSGELQVFVFAALVRTNFKDHGKHALLLCGGSGGDWRGIAGAQEMMLSRHSAGRIVSRCIKWMPRVILISRLT